MLSVFLIFCQKLCSKRIVFHNVIYTGRVILLIRYLIDQYPELYLDELRDWIYFRTGETYAIPTLSRCLSKIGLSVKKVSKWLLFSPLIGVYNLLLVRTSWANAGENMVWEDFCGTLFFSWVFFLLPEDVETSFDIFANFCIENIPSSPTYSPDRKFQSLLQNVFSITVKMSRNL